MSGAGNLSAVLQGAVNNIPNGVTYQTRTISASATLLQTDNIIIVNSGAAAITITLYASPSVGQIITIKDDSGNAASNNITVQGNGFNVDGQSSFVYTSNNQSTTFIFNGVQWDLYSNFKGQSTQTAPTVGHIGEVISFIIPPAGAVNLINGVTGNVGTVTVTPGIWDISSMTGFSGGLVGTVTNTSISLVSAVTATFPYFISVPLVSLTASDLILAIPPNRVVLTANTSFYLTATAAFTLGTAKAYGSFRALRVAQ